MPEHQSESMLTLHEDAFYEFFRPYRHARAQYDIWAGSGWKPSGKISNWLSTFRPRMSGRSLMAAMPPINGF